MIHNAVSSEGASSCPIAGKQLSSNEKHVRAGRRTDSPQISETQICGLLYKCDDLFDFAVLHGLPGL